MSRWRSLVRVSCIIMVLLASTYSTFSKRTPSPSRQGSWRFISATWAAMRLVGLLWRGLCAAAVVGGGLYDGGVGNGRGLDSGGGLLHGFVRFFAFACKQEGGKHGNQHDCRADAAPQQQFVFRLRGGSGGRRGRLLGCAVHGSCAVVGGLGGGGRRCGGGGVVHGGEKGVAVLFFVFAACELGLHIFADDAGGGFFNQVVGDGLVNARAEAETFAKPVTDGASAARRHFEKSVMLCLISVGDEPSPLHFRFQPVVAGFAKVSFYQNKGSLKPA